MQQQASARRMVSVSDVSVKPLGMGVLIVDRVGNANGVGVVAGSAAETGTKVGTRVAVGMGVGYRTVTRGSAPIVERQASSSPSTLKS